MRPALTGVIDWYVWLGGFILQANPDVLAPENLHIYVDQPAQRAVVEIMIGRWRHVAPYAQADMMLPRRVVM